MKSILQHVAPYQWPDLQAIGKEAYAQNFGDHWEANGLTRYLEMEFGEARLQADLQDENVGYFFIQPTDEPVGFVKAKWSSPLPGLEASKTAELEKLYLLPSQKGKGLGKQALQELIDLTRSQDTEFLFLCVIDTNTAAIRFYESLGFAYHSRTRLNVPDFKEELRGMHRMILQL